MRPEFEKVMVVDFFGGGFGEKARLIKKQQIMKCTDNRATHPLPEEAVPEPTAPYPSCIATSKD